MSCESISWCCQSGSKPALHERGDISLMAWRLTLGGWGGWSSERRLTGKEEMGEDQNMENKGRVIKRGEQGLKSGEKVWSVTGVMQGWGTFFQSRAI